MELMLLLEMITGAGRARHCESNCSASDNERRDNNERGDNNESRDTRNNDDDDDDDNNARNKTTCDDANNEKREKRKRTQVKQSEKFCIRCGKLMKIQENHNLFHLCSN